LETLTMPDQVSISIVITRGGDGALIEAVSVAGVDQAPGRLLMRRASQVLADFTDQTGFLSQTKRCFCVICVARRGALARVRAELRGEIARAASVFAVGASAARR
jgi:hypothetical protein